MGTELTRRACHSLNLPDKLLTSTELAIVTQASEGRAIRVFQPALQKEPLPVMLHSRVLDHVAIAVNNIVRVEHTDIGLAIVQVYQPMQVPIRQFMQIDRYGNLAINACNIILRAQQRMRLRALRIELN